MSSVKKSSDIMNHNGEEADIDIALSNIDLNSDIESIITPSLLKMCKHIDLDEKKDQLHKEVRCSSCFMLNCLCICDKIKLLFKNYNENVYNFDKIKGVDAYIDFELVVYMHSKEWGRASNTGKILSIGMKNAEICIFGVENDLVSLDRRLKTQPALVIYPSVDSKPIGSWRKWAEEVSQKPCDNSSADVHLQAHGNSNKSKKLLLIVIDSTWSQAQAMVKSIPARIPR